MFICIVSLHPVSLLTFVVMSYSGTGTDRGGRDPESDVVFARSIVQHDAVVTDSTRRASPKKALNVKQKVTGQTSPGSSGAHPSAVGDLASGADRSGRPQCEACRHPFARRAEEIVERKVLRGSDQSMLMFHIANDLFCVSRHSLIYTSVLFTINHIAL